MFEIIKILEVVLSWPSQNGDEGVADNPDFSLLLYSNPVLWFISFYLSVSKSQHGCIDCMALMICAELQAPDSFSASNLEKIDTDKKKGDWLFNVRYISSCRLLTLRAECTGNATLKGSILCYVIHQLINGTKELVSTYHLDNNDDNNTSDKSTLSFRLCMANVLISACQKLSDSRKKRFARKVLPRLICFVEVIFIIQLQRTRFWLIFLCSQYHFFSFSFFNFSWVSNVVGNNYTGRY